MKFFSSLQWFCLAALWTVSGAFAAQTTVNLGGTRLVLEDVSADVHVHFRAMRLNRALNVWNFEASLTNRGIRDVHGPFVLIVESFTGTTGPLNTDGSDESIPPRPFFEFSGLVPDLTLSPGEISLERTLTLARGTGTPQLVVKVYAAADQSAVALGFVRTLNSIGQPLTNVSIEQTAAETNVFQSDLAFGVASIGVAGQNTWKFSAPGFVSVWRSQLLIPGGVTIIPSPRLTPRNVSSTQITVLQGAQLQAPGVRIDISPGAVQQNIQAHLTPLDGQSLPFLLPLGWSPLQAFWLESAAFSATLTLAPWGPVRQDDKLALAKFDEANPRWVVTELHSSIGTNAISSALAGPGAYALVVADRFPIAPPPPQIGSALAPSQVTLPPPGNLLASGTVDPSVSAASRSPELVTATAEVAITNSSGAIPSGVVLQTQIREEYRLADGTSRNPPRYDNFIIAYQNPGDANTASVHARFPLRPLFLFGPEELELATITVDVLDSPRFDGAILNETGGSVATGRLRINAAVGDVSGNQSIQLRALNPADFFELAPSNSIEAAFELAVSGINPGRHLSVLLDSLAPNATYVIARVIYEAGQYGLQPLERLATDGARVLTSAEPSTGERLDGVTGAGQYVILKTASPQQLVLGTARNSLGQPAPGMLVGIEGQPWITLSGPSGAYKLIAPSGNATVSAIDLSTGDDARTTVSINLPVTIINLAASASGPAAFLISPTNSAANVSRVAEIRVGFSEPIHPGTLTSDAVQLLTTNGPVAASVVLNLRNTIITILPNEPLAGNRLHTISLSTNITDSSGLSLVGSNTFTFTTESDLLDRSGVELVIFEPGATNVPANIRSQLVGFDPIIHRESVVAAGSPGTAEGEVPVILVNDNTGETSTVLSKPDGSFASFIHASEEDFISAVFVNANGSRTTIPAGRQLFDDGSVGLYQGGGILEAESDGGPVQVIVEPGAIPLKTKFKVEPFSLPELLSLIGNVPPSEGKLVGRGVKIRAEGSKLTGPIDISVPVSAAELEAAGLTNGLPSEAVYALVTPTTVEGDPAYMLLDKMEFENGRLVTHSEPFPGADLLLRDKPTATQEAEAAQSVIFASALPAAPGGNEAVLQLGVAPLLLAAKTQPVIFTGKVLEKFANAEGISTGIRPVAGALVTVRPVGGSRVGARAGRLQPGEIYAVSRANGTYAMMRPHSEFGGPLDPTAPRDEFLLTAQHPARFGDRAFAAASAQAAIIRLADLIFEAFVPRPSQDPGPPALHIFHTPLSPRSGTEARITVLATHGSELPSIDPPVCDGVESLVGEDVSCGDVHIFPGTEDSRSATSLRMTFPVRSDKANVKVTLRFRSRMSAVPDGFATYSIQFKDSDDVVPHPPASDVSDRVGPRVVRSSPVNDRFQLAPALAPGEPILIEFNEPILAAPEVAVELTPPAGRPIIELSSGQRFLTVRYYDLKPDTKYELRLTPTITDLRENRLDQDPLTLSPDGFSLKFRTAPAPSKELSGIDSGGGVVLRGIYSFSLERAGPLDGAVVVHDLSNPSEPVATFSVPGFPRDLALIPRYSYVKRPGEAPLTNDLLAVVGGKVGSGVDQFGNLLGGFQYLWIIDISNPTNPQRLAAAAVTLSPVVTVTKVQWSPPYLAYLESGADAQTVNLVNLQSFILGSHLAASEFGDQINPGKDANGDGDFVDVGDELPIPHRDGSAFAGKENTFAIPETNQKIIDFHFERAAAYLGVTLSRGRLLDLDTGGLGEEVPFEYRTLLQGNLFLDRERAAIEINPSGTPKRVFSLFNVGLRDAGGQERSANLALVSVNPESGSGLSRVDVIDITDPISPTLLQSIAIPPQHGLVQSIIRRGDGQIIVAASEDTLLLDPSKLALPTPPNRPHPALSGVVAGMGSGARSFDSSVAGVHVVNLGAKQLVKQTAPKILFVAIPEPVFDGQESILDPEEVVDRPERVARLLQRLQPVDFLSPAAFKTIPEILLSGLQPPNRLLHYHVLVIAPGWAGEQIEVALESLNESLAPLRNKGLGFPPVRAMSDLALHATGQRPINDFDAPIRTLTAYQLETENKADPNYNVYLSKPFALTIEPMTLAEVAALRTPIDREVLWSGHFLRAYLDVSMVGNAAIGPFAAYADQPSGAVRPGVMALAQTFPGDQRLGPNPRRRKQKTSSPGSMHSVALHNGEFENETVDISLPSRRMPIAFKRSIKAHSAYHGVFGRGWDFNYNQRMVRLPSNLFPGAPAGAASPVGVPPLALARPALGMSEPRNEIPKAQDVLFHDGEGDSHLYRFAGMTPPSTVATDPLVRELEWPAKASAFYDSPPGIFDILVQFKDARFARLLPDGTQFWYSPQGRLETIYDRYTNNVHVLHYNDRGELLRIQDKSVEADRYLDLGYYRTNFEPLSSPSDERTGNLALLGRVRRLKDYAGREVLFHYDNLGLLVRRDGIEVTLGLEPGSAPRQQTHYTYGLSGPIGGNSLSPLQNFPTANNISGIIGGDPSGAPLIVATAYAPAAPVPVVQRYQGANGPVSLDILYDNSTAGLANGTPRVKATTQDGAANLYTLDNLGLPESTEMSGPGAGSVTYTTSHNDEGLPTRIVYPLGNAIEFFYEQTLPHRRSRANLRAIERHPHGLGPILRAEFAHESKYNLRSGVQTDFNGNSITYSLTPNGLDLGEISYPNVAVTFPAGVSAPFPVGTGGIEIFEYNSHGQIERQVDIAGVVRKFIYRPQDGFLESFTYGESDEALTTRLTYSGGFQALLGLPSTRISPRGSDAAAEILTYNEKEQLVTATRGPMRASFLYDANGRVVRRTSKVDATRELTETLEYEHNGFLRRRTLHDVETASSTFGSLAVSAQDLTVEYEPDEMFRVRKTIFNPGTAGETIKEYINFDHLGRPERMKFGEYEESYTYDNNGNLRTLRRGAAETEYIYDGHNRLEQEIHPVDGLRTERVTRAYYDSGAVKEITILDSQNQVNSHTTFLIDTLGRAVATIVQGDGGPAVQMSSFDGVQRRQRQRSSQGEISEILYEDNGRPISAGDSVRTVEFTHDRNGNITESISREGPGGLSAYTTKHFPYDELDRSRELADDEGRLSSFDYRVDGQLTRVTDARALSHTFDYTLLGEPTLRGLPSGVEFHFSYDQNRQPRLEGDRLDEGWEFGYDSTLRMERHALRDGNTFKFSQFDERNRPRRVEFPEGTAGTELQIETAYDLRGRVLTNKVSYVNQDRQEVSSYDALDRVTTNTFSSSGVSGRLVYRYDLLGPPREMNYEMLGNSFRLLSDLRTDGIRTNVSYPSGKSIAETRDLRGRKLAVVPQGGDPVVLATDFAASDLIGRQTLGQNLIVSENTFDVRKRLLHRKYIGPGGRMLAELRYAFDPNNNIVARQSVHRGGRTDFFKYDINDRLIRTDFGVRPPIVSAEPRALSNFTVPSEAAPSGVPWAPGFFAREYSYDTNELDLLVRASAINPDGLALLPFAALRGGFDASLHAGLIDGVARGRNSLSDTTNTVLQVRIPGSSSPEAVSASMQYDGLGQLVRIVRADGVDISYAYLPGGLCCYRRVAGPANRCVPSERIFVWDGPRLIEEYETSGGGSTTLRARYYYAESDVPVASDLRDAGGTLRRHYFLMDAQGSVLAAVDSQGGVVERYSYADWGEPEIERSDTLAPTVRRIISDRQALLIEFSERVLPPLTTGGGASEKDLATVFSDFSSQLAIEQSGAGVAGSFVLVEGLPGFAYGTVVRFQPLGGVLSGNLTLRIQAAALNDEWSNPVTAAVIPFVFNPAPAATLFQNLVSTAPTLAARTVSDQPFLFHGQYFDFEAGLIYMRARFYDPFTGLFLQPDPAGYEDSVNPYAAFAHNPQSMRDPSGAVAINVGLAVGGAVIGSSLKVYHEATSNPDATFRDNLAAGLSGAFEGAVAGATLGASAAAEGVVIGLVGGAGGALIDAGVRDGRIAALDEVAGGAVKGAAFGLGGAVVGKTIGLVAGPAVSGIAKGWARFGRVAQEPIGDVLAVARGPAARFSTENTDAILDSAEASVRGSTRASELVGRIPRAELERMATQGRNRILELEELQRVGRETGDIQFIEKDLGPISFNETQGIFAGDLGAQSFKNGKSTIKLNSNLRSDPRLAIDRQLTLMHELDHADQALSTRSQSANGFPKFVEEFSVHMNEVRMELALRGIDATIRSPLRRAFEHGGKRGVVDYLFKSEGYRKKFGASSYEELVRQQGAGFSFGL